MTPLAAPFSAPDGALTELPRPADQAHRAISEALAFYRSTHELDDTPRLHVSRAAWDAIVSAREYVVTDHTGTEVTEYAGYPVTVSNFADRPGIWCDAMPQRSRRTATEELRDLEAEVEPGSLAAGALARAKELWPMPPAFAQ